METETGKIRAMVNLRKEGKDDDVKYVDAYNYAIKMPQNLVLRLKRFRYSPQWTMVL